MGDDSYKVCSLNEAISVFLENARVLSKKRRSKDYLMYRGQTSDRHPLQPSVFRKNRLNYEALMFKDLKRFSPLDFPNTNSNIENLIKMQHYGLPTRLLDFSLNPLVALYFACQRSKNKLYKNDNGEIVAFYETIEQIDSEVIERCSKLITYNGRIEKTFQKEMDINESLSVSSSDNNKTATNLDILKKYFPTKYFFIPAIYNNERIRRQNGVFMLFGHDIEFKNPFRKSTFIYDKEKLKTRAQELNVQLRIIVPSEKKESILFELNAIGINHAFLFPELEHQATYLADRYSSLSKVIK